MSYQWLFDGTSIPGATQAAFTVSDVQLTDQGTYSVQVANGGGTVLSSNATLTVPNVPPMIITQPQSQALDNGNNPTLSVAAIGTEPLFYQWSFNGMSLPGATGAALALNNLTTNNAGNYSVLVANSAGLATSAVAVLTVHAPPYILAQPQSLAVLISQTAVFSVSALSQGGINYQWYFNGTALPNSGSFQANQATLTLTNVQMNELGNYSVVVQNGNGFTTSTVATLSSIPNVAPIILTQPQSQALDNGNNAAFSVAVSGSAPLSFQWYFNDTYLAGATNASLSFNNVTTNNAGKYRVLVMNSAGAVTSAVAVLTVHAPPYILAQPQSQGAVLGRAAVFSVSALSQGGINYQWYFNGTALQNSGSFQANQATLTLTNVQANELGNYAVVLQNGNGFTTSAVAVLTPANLSISRGSGMSPNGITLQLTAPVGATFVISASGDLQNWAPVYTNVATAGTLSLSDPHGATLSRRFYKVLFP